MDTDSTELPSESGLGSYALSGKVMLCSVIILFLLVIVVISFHFYARWLVQRTRRRRGHYNHRLLLNRRTTNSTYYLSIYPQALDRSVLKSLPTFVYNSGTHPKVMDCTVCLSEFYENETGRTLPKCGHSFHFDCIDMWFQSHSNCPLCIAPVESSVPVIQNPNEVVVSVPETESRSGVDLDCNRNDGSVSSAPGGFMLEECPRKSLEFVEVVVRLPPREGNDQVRNNESGGCTKCDGGGFDSRVESDKSFASR